MSCSSDDQSDKECPLCMETLEFDDVNFYPCKCEYQICRFCWHRIRTDENGLCPACRQPYPEDPVNFKPLSTADLQKIKSEKKLKAQAEKLRISESRKHLASYRVLQKNLVYIVGLSQRVADPEVLKRPEYFGRFGKILKIVVGTTTNAPPQLMTSHTAYVTYGKVEEALRAIQTVNNCALDGRVVKASLGTTKYCSSFLRTQQCYKPDCMYLHDIADSEISFTKDDMHMGKHAEYERRLIESVLSRPTVQVPPTSCSSAHTPVATVPPTPRQPMPMTSSSSTSITSDNKDLSTKDSLSEKENEEALAKEKLREIEEEKERRQRQEEEEEELRRVEEEKSRLEAERLLNEAAAVLVEKERLERIERELEEERILMAERQLEKEREERERLAALAREREPSPTMDLLGSLGDDSFVGSLTSALPQAQSRLHSWKKNAYGDSNYESPINAPAPVTSWQALLGLTSSAPSPPPVSHEDTHISRPLFSPSCLSSSQLHSSMSSNQQSIFSRPINRPSPPPGLNGFCSDDDLGFDPFSESSKGLADLLEEERRYQPSSMTQSSPFGAPHMPFSAAQVAAYQQQAHAAAAATHHAYLSGLQQVMVAAQRERDLAAREREHTERERVGMHSMNGTEQWMRTLQHQPNMPPHMYGALGQQQQTQQQQSQRHSHEVFSSHNGFGSDSSTNLGYAPPPGLGHRPSHPGQHLNGQHGTQSAHGQQQHHSMQHNGHGHQQQMHHSSHQQQQHQSMGGGSQASNSTQKASLTEWQEGLKALLPNVNIRFAADMEQNNANATGNWARWSSPNGSSVASPSLQNAAGQHHGPPPSMSHPPALSSLSSLFGESSSRDSTSATRLMQHIPPPPGFSIPANR